MRTQDKSNHARYIPLYHFVVPVLLLGLIIGSIVNLLQADDHTHYSAALIVVIAFLLPVFYWYCRWFALRAQDRAIRAEENLRHLILTGKPLDRSIRMGQIIALRFASDEEFPALVKKANEEKMTARQIKEAIRNWKPDFNRV